MTIFRNFFPDLGFALKLIRTVNINSINNQWKIKQQSEKWRLRENYSSWHSAPVFLFPSLVLRFYLFFRLYGIKFLSVLIYVLRCKWKRIFTHCIVSALPFGHHHRKKHRLHGLHRMKECPLRRRRPTSTQAFPFCRFLPPPPATPPKHVTSSLV